MVKNILAISAGHGDRISGAVGIIDEHNEAVKIVKRVGQIMGNDAVTFVEKTATTQNSNLLNIVKWHNTQNAQLHISVHFNSAAASAHGTETFYFSSGENKLSNRNAATKLNNAMVSALGTTNRGVKSGDHLYVIRNTHNRMLLLEVCFVGNTGDVKRYKENFEKLCQNIADAAYEVLNKPRETFKSKKGYIVTKEPLNVYNGPRWDNPTRTTKKGSHHKVVGVQMVEGYPMYKTDHGNFLSAHEKYSIFYTNEQYKNVCK